MCTTSNNSGICSVSIQLPLEWFSFNEYTATASIEVRIIGRDDLPDNIGTVLLYSNEDVTVTDSIAFVLPSQPLIPGETFTAIAYGHATYAIATFSLMCTVSNEIEIVDVHIDETIWLSEVRKENSSSVAVVSILKESELAVFDEIVDLEELFTMELLLKDTATSDDSTSFECTINYLSNVLNEKIIPFELSSLPSAIIFDYNTTNEPNVGTILVREDKTTIGLLSYTDQVQIINLAYINDIEQIFPIHHYLINSNGQLEETTLVNCSTNSKAFYLSDNCLSLMLNGTEETGANMDTITVAHNEFTSTVYLRVWYPFSGAELSVNQYTLYPVKDTFVKNSSNDCVQLWEQGKLELFVDYSFELLSQSRIISLLSFVVDQLYVSEGPGELNANGVLAPLSGGNITVSAGPRLSPVIVFANEMQPQEIKTMGITIFSNLMLTLPAVTQAITTNDFRGTALLEQNFDSINAPVYIIAGAILEDGYNLLVSYQNGLRLESLDQSIVKVSASNDSLFLISSGQGQLLSAQWISECTSNVLAEGIAYGAISVPDPLEIELTTTSLRITNTGDYADIAGIPTSVNITVFLKYPDNESRNVVSDSLLNITVQSSVSGLVSVINTNELLTLSLTGDEVLGEITVLADYNNGQYTTQLQIISVAYSSLSLLANPYPEYESSNEILITTLYQVYPTNKYQRAQLAFNMILTDSTSFDITDSQLAAFSTLSTIITPSEPGEITIDGRFGSLSDVAVLNLTVSNEVVIITSIDSTYIGIDTLSGIADEATVQLLANVTFNDSTKYPNFLPDGAELFEDVLSLQSSNNAIKLDSNGLIQLIYNHHDLVTVTLTTALSGITETVSFACNLQPAVSDVDLGAETGIPIPSLNIGSDITVPLRVNIGNNILMKAEILLLYDNLLEVTNVVSGKDWVGTVTYVVNKGEALTSLLITGEGISTSGIFEFAVLHVTSVSPGLAEITGIVQSLKDTDDNVIGIEGNPIIAGSLNVQIQEIINKRSIDSVISKRESICDIGDVNGDCIFDDIDVQYLLSELSLNVLNTSYDISSSHYDIDNNLYFNPSDAYYLYRVSSAQSYLVNDLSITPASSATSCVLELNATVVGGRNQAPQTNTTVVFFDLSLPFDLLFEQQDQLDSSFFYHGSVVLSPKSIFLHGAIIQAEQTGLNTYTVSMATNLTSSDIGLSLIIVTANNENKVTPGRIQTLHGSPYSPYEYKYPLDIELNTFNSTFPLMAQNGYNAFDSIDNSIALTECKFFVIAMFSSSNYIVSVPENASVQSILVTVMLSVGSIEDSDLQITSGNENMVFDLLPNGSLILNSPLDYETTSDYILTVTSSENINQTMTTTMITINVTDINDNSPVILPIDDVYIVSNVPVGSTVFIINGTDADSSLNGMLEYVIFNDDIGLFVVNETTGHVMLNVTLNVTEDFEYVLTVGARDFGTPSRETQVKVNITITEFLPPNIIFDQDEYVLNVTENVVDGTFVTMLQAQVLNSGESIQVNYSIITAQTFPFVIGKETGTIQVSGSLDREEVDIYVANIEAKALVYPDILTATSTIKIYILDENDNQPQLSLSTNNLIIYEDVGVPTELDLNVSATDNDIGSNSIVTFSLSGTSSDNFIIDSSTGQITLNASLDYESEKQLQFTIVTNDNGDPSLNDSESVTITVIDVNDNPPRLVLSPASITVNRSIPIGFTLTEINVTDDDTDVVNGELKFTLQNEYFGFSSDYSQLILVNSIANVTDRSYNLSIIVQDISKPILTTETYFIVFIDDIDLNTPRFINDHFTFELKENSAQNTTVVDLNTLLNPDYIDPQSELEFLLLDENQNTFSVMNGKLYSEGMLDYETVTSYLLEVLVRYVNNEDLLNNTATINITITDVNDNFPIIGVSNTSLTVSAITPVNSVILQIQVTDVDSNENGEVDLALTSDVTVWSILGNELVLKETLIIDEAMTYFLTIVATDRGVPSLNSSVDIVIMTDPFTIKFEQDYYMTDITEDTKEGTNIINVTAITNSPSEITYSIVTDTQSFSVDDNTGMIFSLVLFDFEKEDFYEFQVQAMATPIESQSVETTVNISLQLIDINDNGPYFTQDIFEIDLKESTEINETIIDLTSIVGDDDTIVLEIEFTLQDADENIFGITTDHKLYLKNEVDYETTSMYTFSVLVRDLTNPLLPSNSSLFIISITDVNDNIPIINTTETNITISSATPTGTDVLQIAVNDLDSGNNSIVDLSLLGGNSFWAIMQNGAITLQKDLNITEEVSFVLTIMATDRGTPSLSSSATLHIFVESVKIAFTEDVFISNITENDPSLKELVSVSAEVSVDTLVIYSFSIETENEYGDTFSIGNLSGVISNLRPLDFEEEDEYSLIIEAMTTINDQTINACANVTIEVIDVNDNSPVIMAMLNSIHIVPYETGIYNLTTDEELAVNITISISDLDSPENSVVKFEQIFGPDSEFFSLSTPMENSINIISNTPLDREIQDIYNISIQIINEGYLATLSATGTFLIMLTDINDNSPIFSQASYSVSLVAPLATGTVVLDLIATDLDAGTNGIVQYNLLTDGNDLFEINETTGVLRTVEDILTEDSFTVNVLATDKSVDFPQSDTAIVNITVSHLIDGRENDFMLIPDPGLGIVGQLVTINSTSYSTNFEFVLSNVLLDRQNISVKLGSVSSSSGYIQAALQQPVAVNCMIINNQIWEDDRTLYLAAQVLNDRNHVQTLPASVFVQIEHSSEGMINSTNTVDASNGSTIITIDIPLTWFTDTAIVLVSCGLNLENLQNADQVSLSKRSDVLFDSNSYVYMELPLSPLLPGDVFHIPIYAESGNIAVGTYALQINCSNQFEIQDISVDSTIWVMASQTVTNNTDIIFTGLLADPFMISSPGKILLANISVLSNANQLNDDAFYLTVHFLGTADKEKILPPPGVNTIAGNASTYKGLQESGAINATSNEAVGLFLHTTTTDILNTAILSGEDISLPITVLSILKSGEIVKTTDSLICSVSHPGAFDVTTDCMTILVTNTHTEPVKNATLTVESNSGALGILTLSVWMPVLPGSMEALDLTLNSVSQWVIDPNNEGCTQQYQRTKVIVSTQFTNSESVIENIIITHLVTLTSSDSSVLTVNDDNIVIGVSPGTTVVMARSEDGSKTVGEIEIAVSSADVEVQGLDVQVVTSISLSPVDISVNSFGGQEIVVNTRQELDTIGSQGVIVVTALYSDGQRNIIDLSEGLLLSPLIDGTVEIVDNTISVIGNGSGVLINAEWTAISCGDQEISSGFGYVSVVLLNPVQLNVSIDIDILAPADSIANQIGVPSSTSVTQATIEFNNGEEQDILNNFNTKFSLLQPENGIILNTTDGAIISATENAELGVHTVLVNSSDYNELNTTINVTVVEVLDLTISARHYPLYEGSDIVVVSELGQIASSGLYQQALVQVNAILSNQGFRDVTNNSDVLITLSSIDNGLEADIISTDDGYVINMTTVENNGMIGLTASLFSISSSVQYSLFVSSDSVSVATISVQTLPNDTFSGVIGTTLQIVPTITLTDGSVYTNLFQDIVLPNAVRFEQSLGQNAITVNENTGIATLQANSLVMVSITVVAIGDSTISASVDFYCNLEPDIGDIDVGNTVSGSAILTKTVGEYFNVPLFVNTANSALDFIEISLNFDLSIIQAIEVTKASQWPSTGTFGYTVGEPYGTLFIAGTFGPSSSVMGSLVHVVDITLVGVSEGKSHLNGTILNLSDRNGSVIGENVPKSIIAGDVEIVIEDMPVVKRSSSRRKRQMECESLSEAGDVDGDCVFDVRDVAYLQSYYLDLLTKPNDIQNVSDKVHMYLDGDRNGLVDPNDALFMLRVAFKLYRFVDDFQISTVMEEKCFLNITLSSVGTENLPAQPESTKFLAYFTHSHSDFDSQFNLTNFTVGTVVEAINDKDVDIVLAEYINDGSYRITADASLLLDEVGISLIQVTFDDNGDTTESRVAILTQDVHSSDSYPAFNFTVMLMDNQVTIHKQLPYLPLMFFNNSLTTEDCISLMAPVLFNQTMYTKSILEDTPLAIDVLQVGATVGHPDAFITFSIDNSSITKYDPFPFVLDTFSGVISTNDELDYENVSSYTFVVFANENRTLTNDSTIIEIIVININDLFPVFEQTVNETINVPASSNKGYFVLQLNATDPDMLDSILYSITSYTIEGVFTIDNSTGIVTVNNNDLFDLNNTDFFLQITAADTQFNVSTSINIFIYLPYFSQNAYLALVSEDISINSTIVNITIMNSFSEVFSFSLFPDYELFSINKEGTITISSMLDFDADDGDSYNMTILAVSGNFYLNSSLAVIVSDVNDNSPSFSTDMYHISIPNHYPLGTVLDIVNVTDADSPPHSILQYSLEASTDSQFFIINENGDLVIVHSLLNSLEDLLVLRVIVNDSIHSVNASIIILLESQELSFPVIPSFVIDKNTFVLGSSDITEDSSTVEISQMFGLFPDTEHTVSIRLGDQTTTPVLLNTPLNVPKQLTVHLLHYDTIIHSHQNDLVLIAQVWDENNFKSTTPDNVLINFNHSYGIVTSSCSIDVVYGRCLLYIMIPLQWFEPQSTVIWTAILENQPDITIKSSVQLMENTSLTQQINNSIIVVLPSGNFLPDDYILAEVYGISQNAIAGFSLLLNLTSDIKFNDIFYNNTHWSISSQSNGDGRSILGILSSPSSESVYTNDYTHLFTLQLQVSQDLDENKDCYISATIMSLSDVVQGPVIINSELDSRSGPVNFVNETDVNEFGLISTITDRIISILLYVDQPVLLNTAVLSGVSVEVPIEVWAGYTSGNLSLYTGTVEFCESSDFESLKLGDTCRNLILTGDEVTSSGQINITLSVNGILGVLTVNVYYPILPIVVTQSDLLLQTIELSITGNCQSNYQQTSLKAYTDFATDNSIIPNVDITDLIMQFMTSSNQSIAIIDSNAVITGIDSGISSICANTFNGTNPSCVNISVKNDDSVFVAGLSVAIQQGIEVTTFEAFESDFIYNVTFELDSKIQNVSQIIVSLQYTDNETQLIPFNELNFQLDDSEIVTINSDGELYALNNGKTNLSVTWVGPGDDCEFQVTKVIPIEVVLLLPTMVAVSPSPLVIHSLTSNSDPSAALGIQTSYEIVLLLEYSNDVVIEPTEVIYNISDDTLAKMNGNIIQANSVSGLVNLTINIPSIETDEITIQFNIVSTVAAMITASPFPVFTNSGTIDMLEIARIESTLYWQQSMLGLQVTLTDGSVIQATEELDGNLFAASSDSLTLTVSTDDNILIINPLNGVESSGTVTVTSIIPQFNGIHKTIIVVSTTVQISGAFVSSLSDNTLIGYQGTHSHRINISIELEDNSSISDILSVSDEFLNIITLNETSESFEISSNGGYLVPLLNTANKQSLTVAVAEGKFIQEITFFVNLIPDVGDTDIGQKAGPPLNTVSTGDDVVVPIYFNSGNNSLAYIEISFTYDNTVLAVSGTTLGNDWANGVYHFNTDNEGLVLFTSIFSESNIVSEQLHLFNVKLTAISPLSETILYTQVLVIGYHDGDVPIISIPYDSIAGNVTVSVTGNTKRAIVEKPIRTKRETIDSSGCNSPPCDCEDVVNGDVNNDCQFDSGDVLELLNYLKLDALLLSNASSVDNSDYDVTLDGVVDVHDAYVLFKALIGYIPLINDIDITPVQSPLSNCQFNIRITLSENTRNDIVYVLLSLETEFETTNITIGELLTYHENPSGGLIKTVKKINDLNEYTATLTTPIIGDIGISVIAQSLDSNNQTSNVRTVQYLGPLPTLYKSDLLIDTGSLFISSSNGYSPLMISYNEIMSDQCSNIPQINPELIDIVFHSPYNATVVWELDNLREGLNLSSLVFVTITECAVDQSREIILQTCQDIDPVQADTNYTALLMTQPFTFYSVIVVGPTTKSNETSEISPEDGKSVYTKL